MQTVFIADKSLVDYLLLIGYKYRYVNAEEKYYTNNNGGQIKINFNSGAITFLNKNGITLNSTTSCSEKFLTDFTKSI